MGVPAIRQDSHVEYDSRPYLRLVKPRAAAKSARITRTSRAAAYQMYVFFAVVVGVVAVLGLGRVWLSVQAAEASIDSGNLRREIKLQRYQGDMLEIQQSALATPSRIQAIAGTTMGMAPANSVSYLDLRATAAATGRRPAVGASHTAKRGVSGMLAKVIGVAAGEAQLLLVGDVGLASR